MNILSLGHTTRQQHTLCTEFEGFGDVGSIFHAGTAQDSHVWIHGFHSRHGIAHNGGVGRGDRYITADQLGWLHSDERGAEGGQRLGLVNIGRTGANREIVWQHSKQALDVFEGNLVLGMVDEGTNSAA